MEVLLIRHGESENNVIAANLKTQYVDSQTHKFDLQEFEKVWLVERLDDPPITARGQRQAGLVAETLSPRVRKHHQLGISEVRCYSTYPFACARGSCCTTMFFF